MESTCEIRDWPVFAPGTFKETGEYFSPADVEAFGRNFQAYSSSDPPALPVLLKLGHHRQQRYAESLGFPSLGRVVAAHTDPKTHVFIVDRAVGVPRIVGSAINSGLIASGSIEIPPKGAWRPPDDPAAEIDGDVVSGVALLGEELPGVPGFRGPRAVFADGTPVPPLTDEEYRWWLERMGAVMANKSSAAGNVGDEDKYAARSLCFSALTFEAEPIMDAPAIIAALQADPALLEQVLAGVQASTPAAAAPEAEVVMSGSDGLRGKNQDAQIRAMNSDGTKGSNGDGGAGRHDTHDTYSATGSQPNNGPASGDTGFAALFSAFSAFSADMREFSADITKRISNLEAAESGRKKEKEESKMSAFVARADADIEKHEIRRKVAPVALAAVREQLINTLASQTFASEADRGKAYDGIVQMYAALPVNPMLRDSIQDSADRSNPKALVASNPQVAALLNAGNLRRAFPETSAKIAEKLGVALQPV